MFNLAVQTLNGSPMFAGIMMLLLNVGSRYITHEMSSNDDEYSQNIFLRRMAVFAVCFVGTRDILLSILLTAGFVVLAGGLFRGKGEESREGMKNPDMTIRAAAGLAGSVDSPAHDTSAPLMFK